MTSQSPLPLVSRTEQVRRAILHQILTGALRPGARLLEAKLSSEFGVSQATVNAALQDLHNQGLVTKQLNRSTNVSRYTLDDIERLFLVRTALEPTAARVLSQNWSEASQAVLRDHVDQMRRSARTRNLAAFCLADFNFHQDVYRLTGNSFLIQAGNAIAAAPFAYVLCDHLEALPTDYLSLAEDHQDVIRAMQEGPDEAARVTLHYISEWLHHSRRALGASDPVSSRLGGTGL
ncbi:MAG TPA: GntR family transcriptional regulator [Bryobacteraceae bacterium]|jgi:DNA-binding GntR family transcriptional regulator|nr:GntR family transcriptional regulator [Bryobacteraceae bacterium]